MAFTTVSRTPVNISYPATRCQNRRAMPPTSAGMAGGAGRPRCAASLCRRWKASDWLTALTRWARMSTSHSSSSSMGRRIRHRQHHSVVIPSLCRLQRLAHDVEGRVLAPPAAEGGGALLQEDLGAVGGGDALLAHRLHPRGLAARRVDQVQRGGDADLRVLRKREGIALAQAEGGGVEHQVEGLRENVVDRERGLDTRGPGTEADGELAGALRRAVEDDDALGALLHQRVGSCPRGASGSHP